MPDPTPGGPTPTPNEEPRTGALFQVLITGERDPTAIYTAIREVESMAGQSVVTQLSSQIETVGSRLEARLDSVDRQLRLVWMSMGFENVPLLGFENVPLFRGDRVPAEGWVDGIWRAFCRIGGGG